VITERTIDVLIKPKSKEQGVNKLEENLFEVRVKSPPLKDKANKELIEVVSQFVGVPKSYIKIVSGIHSKHKKLKITLYKSGST